MFVFSRSRMTWEDFTYDVCLTICFKFDSTRNLDPKMPHLGRKTRFETQQKPPRFVAISPGTHDRPGFVLNCLEIIYFLFVSSMFSDVIFSPVFRGQFAGFPLGARLHPRHTLQLLFATNPSCRLQHRSAPGGSPCVEVPGFVFFGEKVLGTLSVECS